MKTAAAGVVACLAFVVLATANSGGYRYGISDQAYYIPAVQQHLTPNLFPRDAALLDVQAHLMVSDELVADLASSLGAGLPTIAAGIYVLTLLVLLGAAVAFAQSLRCSWWSVTTLALLLTFRHRITKVGANSLEGYMHPRQLAFGLGVAALACAVRGRHGAALVIVTASALIHPTTALWFGLAVVAGLIVARREWRLPASVIATLAALAAAWAVWAGPLSGRLIVMDAAWLAVLAEKDYLFPTAWPPEAWLFNLGYPLVIWFTWRARERRSVAVEGEGALVAGLMVLAALFLISVPLTSMRLALAVQLQVTRVFWVLDFVTAAYVAWWLSRSPRMAVAAIAILAAASIGRGYFLLEVNQPERRLVTIGLPPTPWIDAMNWLRGQPAGWHVLADPGHAWRHGISVRLAAEKDTVIELGKDSALAIYDRQAAMRVAERVAAIGNFDRLSTARARAIAEQYDVDVVVVEAGHRLDLPELYRNSRFAIFDLR